MTPTGPRSRPARVTAVAALLLAISGCAIDRPTEPASGSPEEAIGHVHGLGVDPADGALYVATHVGLFRVEEPGSAERVADRWQDVMAFAVVGPRNFLASGHPDLTEDLPVHLGLIESDDAGRSWRPLALQGEADFHILEQAGDALYAYDAVSGRLLRTRDRVRFEQVAAVPMVGLTALAGSAGGLIGADPRGRLFRLDTADDSLTALRGPATVVLDTTTDGEVVGVGPDGQVRTSEDGGRSWRVTGSLEGPPVALTTTAGDWYAATTTGVLRSSDRGRTWQRVL